MFFAIKKNKLDILHLAMKRWSKESYEAYKERRKAYNNKRKSKLKPRVVWPSWQGTYVKPSKDEEE